MNITKKSIHLAPGNRYAERKQPGGIEMRKESSRGRGIAIFVAGFLVLLIVYSAINAYHANNAARDAAATASPLLQPQPPAKRPVQPRPQVQQPQPPVAGDCIDEPGCDNFEEDASQPQAQTVVMPDLTGAQVSEAKNWLRANLPGVTIFASYDGNASSECRGFDQGYIQTQTPWAGTEVTLPKTVFVNAVC
jgi:hypothetical protein